ncbi:MAG: hypothetical protein H7834_09650 [Magnetococcus sp. YQC-9]
MRDGESRWFPFLFSMVWTVLLAGGAVLFGVRVFRELDVVALSQWASLPPFLSVPLQRQGDNAIIATLAGVVAAFLFLFIAGYLLQALLDGLRLGLVARSLQKRALNTDDPRIDPPLAWNWFYYGRFSRLWREFASSLSLESIADSLQGKTRMTWVATLAPEMVFSQQSLVDVPMRVEFFRHLPGILTGAGIVSTFAGILMGLTGFDPSVGADQVTRELQGLFTGVSTAFSASFFAIVTAILVTVVEKFLLHWRYAQVVALQGQLNRLFVVAGTGGVSHSAGTVTPWETPVDRIVAAIERLEPLLARERGEREDAIMAVNLGLSGVMATMERIFETHAAREAEHRQLLRGWASDLTTLMRGIEAASGRQVAACERITLEGHEARDWLDGRLATLEAKLTPTSEPLSLLEGQLVGFAEALAQDENSRVQLGEELRAGLNRIEAQLAHTMKSQSDFLDARAGERDRIVQLAERLGVGLDALGRGVDDLGQGVTGLGRGVVDLGRRLEVQSAQQIERSQEWAVGLDRLSDGVEAQRGVLQRQLELEREGFAGLNQRVFEISGRLGEGIGRLEQAVSARDGAFSGTFDARFAALERAAVDQVEATRAVAFDLAGAIERAAAGQDAATRAVAFDLVGAIERAAAGQDAATRAVAFDLVGAIERAAAGQDAATRAVIAELTHAIERAAVGQDETARAVVAELTGAIERVVTGQGEAVRSLSESLYGSLEQLRREQGTAIVSLSGRMGEWGERLEGLRAVVNEIVTSLDACGGELNSWRGEQLERVERLRQGIEAMSGRMPAGEALAGWIREAVESLSQAAEGRQVRLEERLQGARGEILTRLDAGVASIEAVRGADEELARRIEGVLHRLEALQGGWRAGIDEIVARIGQAASASDGLLRELLLKVERVAASGEEGMALLFGEMGREMERMRRQIREAAGQVTVQTREWLTSSAVGGEEKLRSLARGVSEEVKSTLHTLADERQQRAGDRESALVERLLTQTAEQAEGVKVAVLEELEETAKQLATHLQFSGEALSRSREEMGREVVNVIAERMESAFGGVAVELAEMRGRLVAEREAMEQSLQAWVNEASRSTAEESRVLTQRLMEVRSHFDERHQGVIGVIDTLGKGLERDLERLREGLYHKNEESARHVEEQLTELGQLLEGVVTGLGREQSVFIEMLGERLDTLRKRLRVK